MSDIDSEEGFRSALQGDFGIITRFLDDNGTKFVACDGNTSQELGRFDSWLEAIPRHRRGEKCQGTVITMKRRNNTERL